MSQLADKPLPLLFPYYGGKFRMRNWILDNMPKHTHYIEPFGGSAAVLLGKRPSPIESYNDLNYYVVGLFRHLKDPEAVKKIRRWLSLTPYSRVVFNQIREELKNNLMGWEASAKWLYYSNSLRQHSWACETQGRTEESHGGRSHPYSMIVKTKLIPIIAKRLKLVQIECMDACDLIRTYDSKGALFYCDPPYVGYDKDYLHSVDHNELIDTLLGVEGMVMLSGYNNGLYDKLLDNGWQLLTKTAVMSAARRKARDINTKRTECLWLNPACQKAQRQGELFG